MPNRPLQQLRRLLFLLLVSLTVQAAELEVEGLETFSAITISGDIHLKLRQGDDYSVVIKTMLGSTDDVLADVSNGKLTISLKSSTFFFILQWFARYEVEITLPALEALHASGSADVDVDGVINAEQLRLVSSGGSDTSIEVDVQLLEIESTGGSDLILHGKADRVVAVSSGGSHLNGMRFEAREADLQASGGSEIVIVVTEKLTAQAAGGSDITYFGNPAETSVESSGGADITQR